MILYFDSYITDEPLKKQHVIANDWLRNSCKNYSMPKRIDIAKYTLASFAPYKWSHVLIRYELGDQEDKNKYESFDNYILKLFPKAIIMHERSDSQADFRKSLEIIDGFNDQWIFYSGNNDQVLITSDTSLLEKLVKKAESYINKYKFISVVYSHFSEFVNLPKANTPFNLLFGQDLEIIEKNDLATVILRHNGDNSAIQIKNKNLLKHWFDSKDFGSARIIRSEDVRKGNITHDQIMVIPNQQIGAHFDAYSHTKGSLFETLSYQVPPLFIPNGFFDKKIKIAYGYDDYREGWVNINPSAKKYSFEDKRKGTDLKITLDDLPAFWKDRIIEIDINEKADKNILRAARDKNIKKISNPWKLSSKRFELDTLKFFFRLYKFRFKKTARKFLR